MQSTDLQTSDKKWQPFARSLDDALLQPCFQDMEQLHFRNSLPNDIFEFSSSSSILEQGQMCENFRSNPTSDICKCLQNGIIWFRWNVRKHIVFWDNVHRVTRTQMLSKILSTGSNETHMHWNWDRKFTLGHILFTSANLA